MKYSNTLSTEGNSVNISATATISSSVSFKYSTDGQNYSDIGPCQNIQTINLVASCNSWSAPTTGIIYIAADFTATGVAPASKVLKTQIVARPIITSISSTSGARGSTLVINGSNFLGLNSVSFGGIAASQFKATATKITVIIPSSALSGKISVSTLYGGTAESSGTFTVIG